MGTDMVPPVPGALVVGSACFPRSHALTTGHPAWFPRDLSPNEPLTFRRSFLPHAALPRCGGGYPVYPQNSAAGAGSGP